MQPHQQVLAVGILWLVTLIIAPYLFTKARSRAFSRGVEIGKEHHRADLKLQLKSLREELDETRAQTEADQRKHHLAVASLKRTIAELEERIMSYTGMAVTRADYERLLGTAETLRLAHRTLSALTATLQAERAAEHAAAAEDMAKRIHAHLRASPASTSLEVAA